jgi:hypothetical protein
LITNGFYGNFLKHEDFFSKNKKTKNIVTFSDFFVIFRKTNN